jgi:hypothetical protein
VLDWRSSSGELDARDKVRVVMRRVERCILQSSDFDIIWWFCCRILREIRMRKLVEF